eukprot:c29262_g1_i1 orf=46-381(+)
MWCLSKCNYFYIQVGKASVSSCACRTQLTRIHKTWHRFCFNNPCLLSYSMYQSHAPPRLKGECNDQLPMWVQCDVGKFIVEDEYEGHPVVEVEVHLSNGETRFVLDGVVSL